MSKRNILILLVAIAALGAIGGAVAISMQWAKTPTPVASNLVSQHKCGDGVCDGPETATNCKADCTGATPVATTATASGLTKAATPSIQSPIRVLFIYHMDPITAPKHDNARGITDDFNHALRNMTWLLDWSSGLPDSLQPKITTEIGGDAAELFMADTEAMALAKRYYSEGHELGTHFHTDYNTGLGVNAWTQITGGSGANHCQTANLTDPKLTSEAWDTNVAFVDRWVSEVIGTDDATKIRAANNAISSFLPYRYDTLEDFMNKDNIGIETGGRDECLISFFGHDAYSPWRPASTGALHEDLNSPFIVIPSAPVLGKIDVHTGIQQDTSVPSMERRFLVEYLERRHASLTGQPDRTWVFGFTEHRYDLSSLDDLLVNEVSQRAEVETFISWLNSSFPNDLKYSTAQETADAFGSWESNNPNKSSFSYTKTTTDWSSYPYSLTGLAKTLSDAHEVEQINVADSNVHVHKMITCGVATGAGSNWSEDDDGSNQKCSQTQKNVYLIWSDKDTTANLSSVLSGTVTVTDGVNGALSKADASSIPLSFIPVVVE